jgi:hypothetical protein
MYILSIFNNDIPPNSLMDSIASPKVKTTKGEGVGVHSLVRNTSGVERVCWSSKMELVRLTSNSITHTNLYKPNNKFVIT